MTTIPLEHKDTGDLVEMALTIKNFESLYQRVADHILYGDLFNITSDDNLHADVIVPALRRVADTLQACRPQTETQIRTMERESLIDLVGYGLYFHYIDRDMQ